jgi:N-acetylneuraminate synthase
LDEYCKSKNIDFCSTPFTNNETDLLNDIDVPFFKIASMDINNLGFLEYAASKMKPIVLSTGMSTLGEIETAISIINKAGNDEIVLLHCISIYPPLFEDIHLNNISMLQKAFGYPVGFSDHTIGYSIPLASIALGACIIEKHFTLDKDLPGWDHEISANPEEMAIICKESRNIVKSLGSFTRRVSIAEQEKKIKFRRSAVVKSALEIGHVLTISDIDFKRPGSGIQPEQITFLLGKKVKNKLEEDQIINWSDFE